MQGLCKCGIVTAFVWKSPTGELESACGVSHATPGATLVDFNRFDGDEYRANTALIMAEDIDAETDDAA